MGTVLQFKPRAGKPSNNAESLMPHVGRHLFDDADSPEVWFAMLERACNEFVRQYWQKPELDISKHFLFENNGGKECRARLYQKPSDQDNSKLYFFVLREEVSEPATRVLGSAAYEQLKKQLELMRKVNQPQDGQSHYYVEPLSIFLYTLFTQPGCNYALVHWQHIKGSNAMVFVFESPAGYAYRVQIQYDALHAQ